MSARMIVSELIFNEIVTTLVGKKSHRTYYLYLVNVTLLSWPVLRGGALSRVRCQSP